MVRVVFMGTPEFSVPALETLVETQKVVGVVTQPDRQSGRGRKVRPPAVKAAALEAGIPVYQPISLKDDDSAQLLAEWQPDVIIVAAYGQILRKHVLDLPPHGCLNIHASLLPRWRGASPIQHAILAGDSATGVSLMQMDQGMDTGPVYSQLEARIEARETAATLHDKLAQLGADLIRRDLVDIIAGRLTAESQDEDYATYAPLIKKSDGEINWSDSANQLDCHIRAMTPWPGAYTHWEGTSLKILEAQPLPAIRKAHVLPGEVIEQDGAVIAAAGSGGLKLERIQMAGRSALSIDSFVRGQPAFIGSLLGDRSL
ncbi:MAG: methionyl-tRNA formyltransferase [Candidatus Promineifilaceae bacterium]